MTDSEANIDTPNVESLTGSVFSVYPPFAPSNPRLWFGQLETSFLLRHVTRQDMKFAQVVQLLPMEVAEEVSELIMDMPAERPYDKLKQALIERVGVSEKRNLDELFSNLKLGDKKPTQLLRHMQQLLNGRKMDEEIFRQLWIKHLPPRVRQILAAFKPSVPIEDLAKAADEIIDSDAHPCVAHVDSSAPHSCNCNNQLIEQVTTLCAQVSRLLTRSASRSRSRTPARSRSRSRSNLNLCWYHKRFGNKARKCVPPCEFDRQQSNGRASQ